MFTGIIAAVGTITALQPRSGDMRLHIATGKLDLGDVRLGDSIAVSGVCLTAVELPGDGFWADASRETLERTILGAATPGTKVNLEKALIPTTRLGGHIVQGHVDGTALCVGRTKASEGTVFRFQLGSGEERYLIDKGSIAIDGISLTVVRPSEGEFDVWIIPHTLAHTTLDDLIEGMEVHVEYDLIAKYVERLVGSRQ